MREREGKGQTTKRTRKKQTQRDNGFTRRQRSQLVSTNYPIVAYNFLLLHPQTPRRRYQKKLALVTNNYHNIIDKESIDELNFLHKYITTDHTHPRAQVLCKAFANDVEKKLHIHAKAKADERKEEREKRAQLDKHNKRIYQQSNT